MMHDVVINDVTIVDGTGAAPTRGHVAVKDGVITAITTEAAPAAHDMQARTVISGAG